nr:hypothetical protein [Rhodopirellula sp. SM50]
MINAACGAIAAASMWQERGESTDQEMNWSIDRLVKKLAGQKIGWSKNWLVKKWTGQKVDAMKA